MSLVLHHGFSARARVSLCALVRGGEREREADWSDIVLAATHEEAQELLHAPEALSNDGAEVDLPSSHRLDRLSILALPCHADLAGWRAVVSLLPVLLRFKFPFRRIQAPPTSRLRCPAAASLRLLDLRLDRRRVDAQEDVDGPVPSTEPVRCPLGPRVQARGEVGSAAFRGDAPRFCEI